MPDLDWIIEYETLPPDEPYSPEPPPPGRRPPRWLWPLVGLMVIATGILIYLWLLGGEAEPLPNPDPPQARLEAVVRMEINALQTGDEEIFARLQDSYPRRLHLEPPLEQWFAGRTETGLAGEIELIDIQSIDEDSALAEIKLTWNGVPYRLIWFYRQDGERWLHTDWRQVDEGPARRLASPHVQITYQQMHQTEATAMLDQVEDLVTVLCDTLPGSATAVGVTLDIDSYLARQGSYHFSSYRADDIALLHYQIPSPLRVRWPWDGRPEPLILASIGRHLAFDLLARPHLESVSPENQAALTLATFWLAHHLLELEPLPTTRWLEEAAERDGLPAAAAFISALTEDVPPQDALAAFGPETVSAITALPDYFGWLTLVTDPGDTIRPPSDDSGDSFLLPWWIHLQYRFDWHSDPWAADGKVYRQAAPEMVEVDYQDGWAIAIPQESSGWEAVYFFRQDDTVWTLARPDETLMGEQRTITEGPFVIAYWAWDEPYIPELLTTLDRTFETVTSNFDLTPEQPYSIAIVPSSLRSGNQITADLLLTCPTLRDHPTHFDFYTEAAFALTMNLIWDQRQIEPPPSAWRLMLGLNIWQTEELAEQLGLEGGLLSGMGYNLLDWPPPATVDSAEWYPLSELWLSETGADWEHGADTEDMLAATRVMAYIVDQYGKEKLPLVLSALETANSMEEWVTAVTGQPLAQFEAAWRAWVILNH